ncbi:MAG TPA: PilZ domain-containing protein [Pyrinomonadaceae bacterium]|jgi:hypothetical protein
MSENLRGKASVPFRLSLPGSSGDAATLMGHTRDMRATGLSLIVPDIRLGEEEITVEDRALSVVLELPSGTVEMEVTPVRHERLDAEAAEQGFLIGVRITEISDSDCVRFVKYLRALR